jgi:hypothetical protein
MLATQRQVDEELDWLALRMVPGLGARTAVKLLDRFRTPGAIFRASRSELEDAGASEALAQAIEWTLPNSSRCTALPVRGNHDSHGEKWPIRPQPSYWATASRSGSAPPMGSGRTSPSGSRSGGGRG